MSTRALFYLASFYMYSEIGGSKHRLESKCMKQKSSQNCGSCLLMKVINDRNKIIRSFHSMNFLGFPSEGVVDAYMNCTVDESRAAFSWGRPDLDLLRQLAISFVMWMDLL
jgi:hypothetical protein